MASEPTWLADGETFSYDVDAKHMGVFWPAAGRMKVLPDVTTPLRSSRCSAYVIGNRVFVGTLLRQPRDRDRRASRCRCSRRTSGFACPSWRSTCGSTRANAATSRKRNRGRGYRHRGGRSRRAQTARSSVTSPNTCFAIRCSIANGLAFVSVRLASDLFVAQAERRARQPDQERPRAGKATAAAAISSSAEEVAPEQIVIERLDVSGRRLEQLSEGPRDWSPACAPDGKIWFYRPHSPHPSIRRCDRRGCRDIFQGFAHRPGGVARRPAPGVRDHGQARIDRAVDRRRRRRATRRRRDRDRVPGRLGVVRHDLGVAPARAARSSGPRSTPTPAARPARPLPAAATAPTLGPTPCPRSIRICGSSTTRRRRSGSSRTSTWRASRVFVALTT